MRDRTQPTRDQKEALSPLSNTLMRFHSFPYQNTILSLALSRTHIHTLEREEVVQSLALNEDGEGCFDLSLTNLKMFSLNLQGAERWAPICCSAVPFTPALITCLAAL